MVVLVGSCVVVVGLIGFIGLFVLYIVRWFIGEKVKYLLFVLVLIGVIILLIVDMLGCGIMFLVEILVGILIVVIGVFYFLYLLKFEVRK